MAAGLLFGASFKSWIGARGFYMVLAAALIPLLLTGSWVATHQADVAATTVSWDTNPPIEGMPVNLTGSIENKGRFDVGRFNATLAVGRVSGNRFIADETTTTTIEGLAAGGTSTLTLQWTPTPGYYLVFLDADEPDELTEIEEFNNRKLEWVAVRYKDPAADLAPKSPTNLTGGGPNADLAVTDITWDPATVEPAANVTFTATIVNNGPSAVVDANVTFRAGETFGDFFSENQGVRQNVSLGAAESTQVTFAWPNVPSGVFWLEAYINATGAATDPNVTNNHLAEAFLVHLTVPPEAKFPDPPERVTIKLFYIELLDKIHLRILLPFIAIFYAAGVLADQRDKGNLTYILTRPVPRWLLPVSNFVSGFSVSAVAISVGLLFTYFLLLGTPEGKDLGFLTTPILVSLVTLLAYGAVFVLISVMFDRPYLIGIGFVAWEWMVWTGGQVEVDQRPLVADWVNNVTLSHHLRNAFSQWKIDEGLKWLPEGSGLDDLRNVLLAALGAIVAAALYMRWREFDL